MKVKMFQAFVRRKWLIVTLFLANVLLQNVLCDISVSTHDLSIQLNQNDTFILQVRNYTPYPNSEIVFNVQHSDIVHVDPSTVLISQDDDDIPITIEAVGAGHSEIIGNSSDNNVSVTGIYVRVTVHKIPGLNTFSLVIGWLYFVAWSVSFYPQIYINFKRKSVVGLNFDFLALNLVGFTLYSVFNLGLYYIPEIKDEYSNRYPRGLNPVQVNDIFFAVHATAATVITIGQCFLYERNEQRVSITARTIMGIFGLFLSISIILSATSVIHWLDFVYYCSYVKLTITLIKYVPQAYMNYKRQSTVGWSIGNIFLDFTGGILSMLQMIINAYNYDDWASIFGDPTKFGLGLFSVVFDIFFIIQHYILYRHTNYEIR